MRKFYYLKCDYPAKIVFLSFLFSFLNNSLIPSSLSRNLIFLHFQPAGGNRRTRGNLPLPAAGGPVAISHRLALSCHSDKFSEPSFSRKIFYPAINAKIVKLFSFSIFEVNLFFF